jgi:hypothetical protein
MLIICKLLLALLDWDEGVVNDEHRVVVAIKEPVKVVGLFIVENE